MGIAIDEPIGQDDLLWHYTDCAALLNIVNNGVLWATQIQYMNDAQELVHIVKEMRRRSSFSATLKRTTSGSSTPSPKRLDQPGSCGSAFSLSPRTATISISGAATPLTAMATQSAIAPETYGLGLRRSAVAMRKRGGRSTLCFTGATSRTLSVTR